jgi:hypothetical protein
VLNRRVRLLIVLLAALAVVAAACSSDDGGTDSSDDSTPSSGEAAAPGQPVDDGPTTSATSESGDLTLSTLSTRASMVTGGDVLVGVSGAEAAQVTLTVNGETVGNSLIEDLPEGDSTIEASTGADTVSLTVTNHPVTGPVFSGPHLEPWSCTTEQAGLGPATDDDCSAPTDISWSYLNTAGVVVPLEDPAARPADLATTEVDGEEVPFIIRTETGTINRGISSIWVLDPEPDPDGAWDQSGWNGRLVFRFGGGCGIGYSQGSPLGPALDTDLLADGYAEVSNTLDTFQTSCNDTLSAEAALMTREHFIEAYGLPEFTIGDGGSGGAIQQLLIGTAYPGILDALSPSAPFPDAISISGGVSDCGLLLDYYENGDGQQLTDGQRAAINGHLTPGTCESWRNLFLSAIDPTENCPTMADDVQYDPDTNPDGVRCTLSDINVNILGVDPDTGFARRPLSNEGIQYGLQALEEGTISVDEFLDLNEHVGGWDIDGNIIDERTETVEESIAVAYRTGRLAQAGPLLDVPIILRNGYTDDVGDIHTRFHSFSIRERLQTDGEDDPNLALWTAGGSATEALLSSGTGNEPIRLLDEWLTAAAELEADGDAAPRAEVLAEARPAEVTNRCTLDDGTVIEGGWEIYDEPGPCSEAFPVLGDSRTASGAPLSNDILACTLTEVDPASYQVELTDAQAERLEEIFPTGICDWTVPGIGQQEPEGTWLDFTDGPG